MTYPVISAEVARDLNARARAIDPVLFWTCNYEPTEVCAVSEDARFLVTIQDLYKFAIDTNCVLRGIAFNSPNAICRDLLPHDEAGELRKLVSCIQNLRTVVDHNHSELNGILYYGRVDAFTDWIRQNLGVDRPATIEDFAVLGRSLEGMGSSLVRLSERALDLISRRADCSEIVDRWVDAVLHWYCASVRQDYYKGQLGDCYVARSCARRPGFAGAYPSVELRAKVNRWIERQTTHRFDFLLRQHESERQEALALLSKLTYDGKTLRGECPSDYQEVVDNLLELISESDREAATLREGRQVFESRCTRGKLAYFFNADRLFEQFRDTYGKLLESGVHFTLLPQDFLQLDVMLNFSGVQSPDSDF